MCFLVVWAGQLQIARECNLREGNLRGPTVYALLNRLRKFQTQISNYQKCVFNTRSRGMRSSPVGGRWGRVSAQSLKRLDKLSGKVRWISMNKFKAYVDCHIHLSDFGNQSGMYSGPESISRCRCGENWNCIYGTFMLSHSKLSPAEFSKLGVCGRARNKFSRLLAQTCGFRHRIVSLDENTASEVCEVYTGSPVDNTAKAAALIDL